MLTAKIQMKQTRLLMGMPITLEIADPGACDDLFDEVFAYLQYIDNKFSTYKEQSEISMINRRQLAVEQASQDMQTVFALSEQMRMKTNGFFNILRDGIIDPSGLVKGWSVFNAAGILRRKGCQNFYLEAGGDIQAYGKNDQGQDWRVGIRSPFNMHEIVKVLAISNCGVATSGTYIRGQHIYNPKNALAPITEIVSLTVIGPEIYTADCYATAAFAMGQEGIAFIANLDGCEGYMIDQNHRATFTPGFARYVIHAETH